MNSFISDIINTTFDALDEKLGKYVVMNKYDELPEKLPSDIDIAIPTSKFNQLDEIVGYVGHYANLVITQKIWHNYHKCAYILTPLNVKEKFRLQLDFFADFSVKSTPMLIAAEEMQTHVRKYKRFTVPDYDVEFLFLLMRRIYKNDFDKEHCDILKNVLLKDKVKVINYAEQYFQKESIRLITTYLINNDIIAIQKMRNSLWNELRRISKKQAGLRYRLKYWGNQLVRTVYRCRYPVGMDIAFLSPDGGGKSTVIQAIQETCWGTFHYMEVKYFRPRIFKNLGHYNVLNPTEEARSNDNPHGVERDGMFKSFIRFMFYNLDFMIGGIIVKKNSVKKTLTIYDRYYYDYYVDVERYKYAFSTKLPHYFQWMIPEPKIVFVLSGRPETLYSRKKELSLTELKMQTKEYDKVANELRNGEIINVDCNIEKVISKITRSILLYKAKETAKAMRQCINVSTGIVVYSDLD